ncbi:Hypothetical_protein [Hexamita inflata]|uniref:Hypothetical_protein n=1 Tax=Hexamita inflata TaxID=28002 RepID=A0AA86QT60_9EUKA|nr:Hypothetical protein HINF_LOCUS46449 [Hexamita inflata]
MVVQKCKRKTVPLCFFFILYQIFINLKIGSLDLFVSNPLLSQEEQSCEQNGRYGECSGQNAKDDLMKYNLATFPTSARQHATNVWKKQPKLPHQESSEQIIKSCLKWKYII